MANLTLKRALDGTLSIIGDKINLKGLNVVQAQYVLYRLDCDFDLLFEALYSFEEHGHNTTNIGFCGGFMWSTYDGINQ